MTKECWYRFEETTYSGGIDEYGDPIPGGPLTTRIHCYGLAVIKHTPKGAWLAGPYGKRFVRRDARKRYACPTVEEARLSFIARKRRQVGILRGRAMIAEHAMRMAEQRSYGDPLLPFLNTPEDA